MASFDLSILSCYRLRLAGIYAGIFIQKPFWPGVGLALFQAWGWLVAGAERQETQFENDQESRSYQTVRPLQVLNTCLWRADEDA